MLRSERKFHDAQCLVIESLGNLKFAECLVDPRPVRSNRRDVRMRGAQGRLEDRLSLLIHRPRCSWIMVSDHAREVAERGSIDRMTRARHLAHHFEGLGV